MIFQTFQEWISQIPAKPALHDVAQVHLILDPSALVIDGNVAQKVIDHDTVVAVVVVVVVVEKSDDEEPERDSVEVEE
jgi:hypothetical protein